MKALIPRIHAKSRRGIYTGAKRGRGMPAAAWGGGFPNILVIFALSGFFALSSCGLDVVPFLYPPESPSAIGSGLQFLHDTRNNDTPQSDNFRGYEIYYKFYDFSGVNGETQLQNDRNAIEADPIPPGTARLTARNYRRLRSLRNDGSLETRLPLIPVSIGSAPSIQLLFSGSVGVEGAFVLRNNNEADAARLVRAVDDADANPRLFYGLDQYATNHADIPNTINLLTDSAALRIAFYAVAYGVQPDFRPLYSIPIFLANEIPLDFQ